jgi:hypothetical protein
MVAFGHTPVPDAEWLNNTIDIDTGCVFGGRLTALRYPERELVAVPAAQVYCEPVRPLNYRALQLQAQNSPTADHEQPITSAQHEQDDLLDIRDVTGKQFIETRLMRGVTIREENAVAALEVMSRFALHPKWLLYLPPTMSPTETSALPDLLEHPAEAFDYYKRLGVERVVCEKSTWAAAWWWCWAADDAAIQRPLASLRARGMASATPHGRNFFTDAALESPSSPGLRDTLSTAGFLGEIRYRLGLPRCRAAAVVGQGQELVKNQYAAVGRLLPTPPCPRSKRAQRKPPPATSTGPKPCWPAPRPAARPPRTTPTPTVATAGPCTPSTTLSWRPSTCSPPKAAPTSTATTPGTWKPCAPSPWPTPVCSAPRPTASSPPRPCRSRSRHPVVDRPHRRRGRRHGGEAYDFVPQGKSGLLQPALKCRGREYLRIIYGPDYLLPGNLDRLRQRNVKAKRNLALREFALGVEGLERFVAGQPLRRVHQCVFGVLALESEAVDPRL